MSIYEELNACLNPQDVKDPTKLDDGTYNAFIKDVCVIENPKFPHIIFELVNIHVDASDSMKKQEKTLPLDPSKRKRLEFTINQLRRLGIYFTNWEHLPKYLENLKGSWIEIYVKNVDKYTNIYFNRILENYVLNLDEEEDSGFNEESASSTASSEFNEDDIPFY